MLSDTRKNILRVIAAIFILYSISVPIFNTWSWREEHFEMFDLAAEMQKRNTDFYSWLGVKPTATTAEIGKAHRQLVVKYHPSTSTDFDAQKKFDMTNAIAYNLRSSVLRPLYDTILEKKRLPYFKGVFYYYTYYKAICMVISGIIAVCVMEYLKAWDKYLTDKMAFDHFIKNAKQMAQKISDKHASAESHKSYIDLGDRTIQCEITKEKDIFLLDDKGKRVPLLSSNLVPPPSVFDLTVIASFRKLFYFLYVKMIPA